MSALVRKPSLFPEDWLEKVTVTEPLEGMLGTTKLTIANFNDPSGQRFLTVALRRQWCTIDRGLRKVVNLSLYERPRNRKRPICLYCARNISDPDLIRGGKLFRGIRVRGRLGLPYRDAARANDGNRRSGYTPPKLSHHENRSRTPTDAQIIDAHLSFLER